MGTLAPDLRPAERAAVAVRFRWLSAARAGQLPPSGQWSVWLVLAGRGWGKTRAGAEWAADKARRYPGARVALVAQTFADGRDTMVEGVSALLSVLAEAELRRGSRDGAWNRSIGELYLANGSQFKVFSSEKPRQLRGPQHHFAWGDEPATWHDAHRGPSEDTTWSNLEIGCRLSIGGSEPRICLTGTPKPVRLLTQKDRDRLGLLHRDSTAITRGHTDENLANLAPSYRAQVVEPLRGTRLGRQELAAEILEDVEGALWRRSLIDDWRLQPGQDYCDDAWRRKVVGLDPADGTEAGAEQALVLAGMHRDNSIYVLRSDGMRVRVWDYLVRAVDLALEHAATIVVEKNHGGAYLIEVLEQVMRDKGVRVPYRQINAGTNKLARAEPVAALYEQSPPRVRHVGAHPQLEDQMTTYTAAPGERSPDRMDALVHALRDLMGLQAGGEDLPVTVPYSDRRVPGGAIPYR